jgi:hypothetical protein
MSLDIFVTDAFLISEMGTTPSPASVWLVEPKRTTFVVKYSGTLVHPTRRDKVGIIVTAFAHYIYEASNKELVLADIQGILPSLLFIQHPSHLS